jgi:hypothetical protein
VVKEHAKGFLGPPMELGFQLELADTQGQWLPPLARLSENQGTVVK